MKKLLLTGAYAYTDKQIRLLNRLGFDIDFLQMETDPIQTCEKYNAIICNGLFLHHNIKEFCNLEYIQLTSAGYDRVPVEYIKEHNIKLNNARGVYSIPIAEHTVMLILELLRNGTLFYENRKNKEWNKNRSAIELYGKTVAIAGCGSIGLEIAKRLNAFGAKIIGIDIYPVKSEYIAECYKPDSIYSIASSADIFISAMPYTKEIHHIFGARFFSAMKKSGMFVNISRGKLVDEAALIYALNNNVIKGAALDVFEEEPLTGESMLWNLDNLIITPHNSFVGDGNNERMFDVIYNNLKDWIG